MRITNQKYLETYSKSIDGDIDKLLKENDSRQEDIQLDFRVKTSAVYSANIEGNSVDLNSYLNSEVAKEAFKPRQEIEEIKDLVNAYTYAIRNTLNQSNLLNAHKLLSKSLLITDKQGSYRTDRMGVYDNSGLVYLALEPEKLHNEIDIFFEDLSLLVKKNISITETFYHASLIHLKFAQIHPFWDGNGRTARLLEKWFLAEKLGEKAWKIESEQFYKKNISSYYNNINLGMDYHSLNYDRCLPFLRLLIDSIKNKL
ncbi:Fic/DOC family protein [Nonlabens dokdonensis]|uniref:Fic family protein n=2 Tax=Nonlabens dokdonensis TaxID=328515 RepID=L7W159_NONDD|nr:Fic family protein [Nonlabens dokdonensis]AGC75225.1 fic family protein [Nonlabens dokdonensis DSW-6]PZX39034.1 Fic/DOC family protein [Nonlabens dokdonensis]